MISTLTTKNLILSQLPNQKAWVAEKSGEVVGCIAVAITNYFHRAGSFLRVIAVIVDEQQRRFYVL